MSIYSNSDYAQNFTLRGKQNQAVVLPDTAAIEIVFVHAVSKERFVCSTDDGRIVLTDASKGKFSLQMPATFTNTMPAGEYKIEAHRVDNQRTRLFGGFVKVEASL